jgi:hypothetical protein
MRRLDLVHDCARCASLCCVATSFEASDDFAIAKPAGVPCPHLTSDHRCGIHASLVERGFRGCAAYGCHGAGQRATREQAAEGDGGARRSEAFLRLRVVHELLWYLTQAARLCPASRDDVRTVLAREVDALDALAAGQRLFEEDLDERSAAARALLRRVGDALGGREGLRRRSEG